MRVAHDDKGQEYGEIGGNWVPIQVAHDDKGNEFYSTGNGKWEPFVDDAAAKPKDDAHGEEKQASGTPLDSYFDAGNNPALDAVSAPVTDGVSSRDLQLAARAGMNGVASLPQLAGMGVDYLAGKVGVDSHLGDTNAGEWAADKMGLAKPENDAERQASAILAGGASALTPMGAGKAIAGFAPKVASFLTAAPIAQVVGGAAAGGVDEYGRQQGWSDGARLGASLAAGVSPAGAAAVTNGAGRVARSAGNILSNVTKTGRERTAGGILASMAEDEMKANPNYFAEIAAEKSPVPGYQRTLGQASGNAKIAAMEHSLPGASAEGQGPLAARTRANADALAEEQGRVLAPIEERLGREQESVMRTGSTKGVTQTPEQAGETIRREFGSANASDKWVADSLYADARARAAGQSAFDPVELRGTMGDFEKPGVTLPSSVTGPMKALEEMAKNGQYPDYELVTEWLKQAKKQARMPLPDANAHYAGTFADNLTGYIDDTVAGNTRSIIGDPEAVSAMRDANAFWRDAYVPKWETGKNLEMLTGGKEFGGVKVPNENVPGLYAGTRTGMEDFGRWATPNARNAMTEYVRGSLRGALKGDSIGSFRDSAAKWMADNPHMKDFAPEVWKEAEDLVRRSSAASSRQGLFKHSVSKKGDAGWAIRPEINLDHPKYNPLFTSQDKGRLKAVQEEAARAKKASSYGRVPGSDTIVNRSLAENLGMSASPDTDSLFKGVLGVGKDTIVRTLGKHLDTGISRRIGDVLTDAMLDPEYAARIVSMRRMKPKTTFGQDAAAYAKGGTAAGVKGGLLGKIEKDDGKKQSK